mgnify:CR=1 FL=1
MVYPFRSVSVFTVGGVLLVSGARAASSVDFGQTPLGTPSPGIPVTIKNTGNAPVKVSLADPLQIVEYKGLSRYLPTAIEWLSKYDDGAPTSEGCGPDITAL